MRVPAIIAATLLLAGCASAPAPVQPKTQSAETNSCDCDTPEELAGFPVRVKVVSVDVAKGLARVEQTGVEGAFPADTRDFKVSEELAKVLRPDMRAFGRVEERKGSWWLFAVRILGAQVE